MYYADLDAYDISLKSLEEFFTDFAAKEDEIQAFGIHQTLRNGLYDSVFESLREFENKYQDFISFLRPTDKKLCDRAIKIEEENKLLDSIVSIEVTLRVAYQKRNKTYISPLKNAMFYLNPFISFKTTPVFDDDIIPIKKLLISLARLRTIVKLAQESYISKWQHDSDVFKPSNLDHEKIISLIETAILELENNTPISKDQKKQLLDFLQKAKVEFSEKKPSWNKIVGALVIAAAITSGIADAKNAYRNIDEAIKYIIGISIEKHIPHSTPLIEHKKPSPENDGIYI